MRNARHSISNVMAGLVPAIHVLLKCRETWMPGTRPGMTNGEVRHYTRNIMAGLVPAIHVFVVATLLRRGCPAQGRA
jgi:hypothetical protein